MEWVEASGKTLVEAKETVLDLLGVAEDDAEFIILSEPKPGLFGRVRGEARVQARVRPVTPPPKRGRKQRSDRKREGGDRAAQGAGAHQNAGEATEVDDQVADSTEGGSTDEQVSEETPRSPRKRNRSRSRGGSGGAKSESDGRSGRGEKDESMQESLTLEEQGNAGREFLLGLVHEFGLEADVTVQSLDDETVQIAALGSDLGLLVGPRGATLSAIQDLTRTFVQRQSENRTDRILVDVGGYREKRIAALRRFTLEICDVVKSTGEDRVLEPMSPADRKVIHDTANEVDGVATRSAGVEPSRYVVIEPAS